MGAILREGVEGAGPHEYILGDFFSLLLQDIFVGRLRRSGTTIQLLQLIDELATDLITPLSHCIKHLAL